MTSQPSREDLEKFLSQRGMPWGEIVKFMAVLDVYVLGKVREYHPLEEADLHAAKMGRKYKCKICDQMKPLSEFPQAKQENTRLIAPCSYCESRFGWRVNPGSL